MGLRCNNLLCTTSLALGKDSRWIKAYLSTNGGRSWMFVHLSLHNAYLTNFCLIHSFLLTCTSSFWAQKWHIKSLKRSLNSFNIIFLLNSRQLIHLEQILADSPSNCFSCRNTCTCKLKIQTIWRWPTISNLNFAQYHNLIVHILIIKSLFPFYYLINFGNQVRIYECVALKTLF
jgi:predicted nucleic acid-binding Zn finger protein